MANNNQHKEEIIERMKELIREGYAQDFIMLDIQEKFKIII